MTRNKKTKNEYLKKRNLLEKYNIYFHNNDEYPVSKEEYNNLKQEILDLEKKYPSIKEMGEDLVLRVSEATFSDGRVYSGAVKSSTDHTPHGDGFMALNKNNISWTYSGEFKNGVFDGEGEFISKGCYSYKGSWKDSMFDGQGLFKDERTNEVYEGEFLKNKKNGFGKCIINNLCSYEGFWRDDKAHGKGKILALKEITKDKSSLINNQYFQVVLEMEKDQCIEGNFINSLFHGEFTHTYSDGEIIKSEYENGKYVNRDD